MALIDAQTSPYATKKEDRKLLHHTLSYLQHNSFKTEDSWVWLGSITYDSNFFTYFKSIQKQILPDANPNQLYINQFYMDERGVMHKREVYTLIDSLGDIGGIIEIFFILFGMIFLPISRHSYYLQAARHMFFARSRDSGLFTKVSEYEQR